MTQQERMEMYRTYLVEEGYCPQVNDEETIVFKYEGGTFILVLEKSDDEFIRLVYPNFWPIENEAERVQVIQAALHASLTTKVARAFPVGNNVCAEIALFCATPEAFMAVFYRSLSALKCSVELFRKTMQPKVPETGDPYGSGTN